MGGLVVLQDKLIAEGIACPLFLLPLSRKRKRERKHLRPALLAFLAPFSDEN
jgi:hypothetical protein